MELRQLECFSAVVEEGSISAAARKLHMSQPPLSLRMHQLEEECGVTLFVRGARQITLTEAGTLLYRYAKEILELSLAAGADLENLRRGRRGPCAWASSPPAAAGSSTTGSSGSTPCTRTSPSWSGRGTPLPCRRTSGRTGSSLR